jgi:hypothetical protein
MKGLFLAALSIATLVACMDLDRPLIQFYRPMAPVVVSPKVRTVQIVKISLSDVQSYVAALRARSYRLMGVAMCEGAIPSTDNEIKKCAGQVGSDFVLSTVTLLGTRTIYLPQTNITGGGFGSASTTGNVYTPYGSGTYSQETSTFTPYTYETHSEPMTVGQFDQKYAFFASPQQIMRNQGQ